MDTAKGVKRKGVGNQNAKGAKRKCLTLSERIKVIEQYDKKVSAKKIALDFGVGKTQIQNTIKDRAKYLDNWRQGENANSKRERKLSDDMQVIDDRVYEWFQNRRARNVPVSGADLQAEALNVAYLIGKTIFKRMAEKLSAETRHL